MDATDTLAKIRSDCDALGLQLESLALEQKEADREEEDKFPLLQAKKNALYRITRIEWDKVRGQTIRLSITSIIY